MEIQYILKITHNVTEERHTIRSDLTGENFFGCLTFESEQRALDFLVGLKNKHYVLWNKESDMPIYCPYTEYKNC
jgi:hypothetical protein